MDALWFVLVALMLVVYTVLDGFDFGAGIVYRYVVKSDEEKRQILSAIGPVWDGNEVWLLAAGGTLFFAFPRAYAAGFSGFYMPLIIILWLLVLRGLSIELRSHEPYALWHDFWDTTFQFASILIAIIFGAAFGNLIRGVPIDASGYFAIPLFTNMLVQPSIGVLDYYTVAAGLLCLAILALHGALFLVWKTDGGVRERSKYVASRLWWAVAALAVITLGLTAFVQPSFYGSLAARVWPLILLLISIAGLIYVRLALSGPSDFRPFAGSIVFIAGMMIASAGSLFPVLITSTLNPSYSLTVYNSCSGVHGLTVGLIWWPIGMVLAVGYFIFVYRSIAGKVARSQS